MRTNIFCSGFWAFCKSCIIILTSFLFSKSIEAKGRFNFTPTIAAYSGQKVFIAEMDGNNFPDIVFFNQSSASYKILFNNGQTGYSGSNSLMDFQENSSFSYQSLNANDEIVDVKDFYGDGFADILIYRANTPGDELIIIPNTAAGLGTPIVFATLLHDTYNFGIMDFENDNDLDVYAYSAASHTLFYLKNGTSGPFTATSSILPPTTGTRTFFQGHFTNPTSNDLLYYEVNTISLGSYEHKFVVLQNSGTAFTTGFSYPTLTGNNTGWKIFTGNFTNTNYTEMAIFVQQDYKIYVIPNTTGVGFGSLFVWQDYLSASSLLLDPGNYSPEPLTDFLIGVTNVPNGEILMHVNLSGVGNQYANDLPIWNQANELQNPLNNSQTWQASHSDFNNDGYTDVLVYDEVNSKIKVGLNDFVLQGYVWPLAANPNETIRFYFAGEGSTSMKIYKYTSRNSTATRTLVTTQTISPAYQTTPSDAYINGCNWTNFIDYTIPSSFTSGYYAAILNDNIGQEFPITFIVRKKASGISNKKVALIANTNTWWVYNSWDGKLNVGTKYANNTNQRYSFLRPNIVNSPGDDNPNGGHRTRAELWIYTWLLDNLYDPDIITDLDINDLNFDLNQYDYVIMGTHPEYWSGQMYDHVKDFQVNGGSTGQGGNLICIGGNAVFEVCDIDLSNPANPQIIAYPNSPGGATTQQNPYYPIPFMPGVGGSSNPSPTGIYYDRFDYFLESYNFGTNATPIYKRSTDLLGTHYNIINNTSSYNNTSYTITPSASGSPLVVGLSSNNIGIDGYNFGWLIVSGGAKASGRECDMYSSSPSGYPYQVNSVYDGQVQIIASAVHTTDSDPLVDFPNGKNTSEIIYVPRECGANHHGFVFTAGSICFGGSLVWGYNGTFYDNDLSRLMKNVLDLTPMNLSVTYKNIDCSSNSGSITATATCNLDHYLLMPSNITNTTGQFSIATSGIYTVYAVDASSQSVSKTVIINAPSTDHCACSDGISLAVADDVILLNNPSSSYINAHYATTYQHITNKTLYFNGTFSIDEDITFDNCTLWFTRTGQVVLDATHDFNTINSTLQASCEWWLGIEAQNSSNKVSITKSSIMQAYTGIAISNDALLEVSQSNFTDNYDFGIRLENMHSPYAGFIKNGCNFKVTNVPAAVQTFNPIRVGIYMDEVEAMNIGDIVVHGSGNTFEDLYTGIWASMNSSSTNCNIGVFNNTFKNIQNNTLTGSFIEKQKINSCYNTAIGAAVCASYTGGPSTNVRQIDIRNTSNQNTTVHFDHCDKGIITNSFQLHAKDIYMDNCLMGIMNNAIVSESYHIEHIKIDNTFIGMQFNGENDNSYVKGCTINCSLYPNGIQTTSGLGAPLLWPKGIEVNRYMSTTTGSFAIGGPAIADHNFISIPHYAGLGISLNNAGTGVAVKDNTVNLGSSDASQMVCAGVTTLAGISSSQALGSRIHRNTINANTFSNGLPNDIGLRVDAAGILIDYGQDQAIGCNSISGSRFGLMAWSENNTNTGNELLVQGNTILNADAGWVFRHLATEGTLGQVGDLSNDNNNMFPTMTGGAKVFKFCLGQTPDKIYNISISITESKSENMNTQILNDCPYLIQANPGATVFNDCGGLQIAPWDGSEIPLDEAMAIATNTKIYVEFPTLAHWYDCKRLYDYLTDAPTLLNEYPTLDSFYTVMNNEAIAQMQATDQQLENLVQSFDIYTPEQRDAMLTYIENSNNGIDNSDIQNENEYQINAIFIKLVRYGVDSLSANDKAVISTLAPQCPYVGGSAVYKARTLNYYLEPGVMYDDMKACNAVNVYKNGNTNNGNGNNTTLITLEDQTLSQIKATHEKVQIIQNELYVYPVPANDYVDVHYLIDKDAMFSLYNGMGERVLTQKLNRQVTKQRIELNNIANGIYHYEVLFANKLKSIGKLTIVN